MYGREEANTELQMGFCSGLKNYLGFMSSVVDAPEVDRDRSWPGEKNVDKEALITSSHDSELASGLRRGQSNANSIDGLLVDRDRDLLYGSERGHHCCWMIEDARRIDALDVANKCLVGSDFSEVLGKGSDGVLLSDDRVRCFDPIDYEDKQGEEVDCFSRVKNSDPVLSCSWTRSRLSEVSRKSWMKRISVHWGKNLKAQHSISGAAKRKRNHSSKLACSSQWGLSTDMPQFCSRTHEHVPEEVPNQCLKRFPDTQVDGHCYNHPNREGADVSSERDQSLNSIIRLKVKFSKSGLENKLIVKLRDTSGDSLVDTKHDCLDLKCHKVSRETAKDASDVDISPPSNVASVSPGSEVINILTIADVGAKDQDDLCSNVLSVPEAERKNWRQRNDRRKKKDSYNCTEKSTAEDVLLMDIAAPKETRCSSPSVDASSNLSAEEGHYPELLPLLEETWHVSVGAEKVPDLDQQFFGPQRSRKVPSSTDPKGQHSPTTLKSEGEVKGRTKCLGYRKERRKMKSRYIKNQHKLVKHSKDEKDACDHCLEKVKIRHRGDIKDHVASLTVTNIDATSSGVVENLMPSEIAWVQCDDCLKWRRVPATLIALIGGNSRWICADNSDKAFVDCSVPQELSDEGISAELDAYQGGTKLSTVSKALESRKKSAHKTPWFRGIKCNQFLHRSRKVQTIDEVLVCHCQPPPYGQLGCGDHCLNRMLSIECVQSTCPCGDSCSNQQFSQRKYAMVQLFSAGKKGHGLRALEDVREGHFILEYVGEVVDGQAYETRLNDYAAQGQRHFYFMTLNANEVIDAGAKGNLGRFINHSCDPNCRTEKWMVNGEICIGIFALRDIRKEEELTFDYNYVRVFGAAAQKCYCGSSRCRGYIGGDGLDSDVIVQSDSDDEELHFLEDDMVKPVSRNIPFGYAEVRPKEELQKEMEKTIDLEVEACEVDANSEPDDSMDQFAPSSSQVEYLKDRSLSLDQSQVGSLPQEGVTREEIVAPQSDTYSESRTICPTPAKEVASPALESKLLCDVDARCSNSFSIEDGKHLQKSSPHMEIPSFSISRKERECKNGSPDGKKLQTHGTDNLPINFVEHKILSRGCSNGRIEAVEIKLNELLNSDGGISKRKDATKGYLKLLLLTATLPGSTSKEGIQSNRDVSMILDALLKTRSRAVLMDVVNKNGLQMLHNTIKQYKNDFKKIPILRKILKVLEYLAERDILTLDNIIIGPPCPGMQSFRDSLLSLTEHDDKQVHQIARHFRDRWIPWRFRGRLSVNKVENTKGFHRHQDSGRFPSEPIISASQPKGETPSVSNMDASDTEPSNFQTTITGTRKRRTRWDQPASKHDRHPSLIPEMETHPGTFRKPDVTCSESRNRNLEDDGVPLGFSCPLDGADIVVVHPQEMFISRLPVSYGIPSAILRRFTPEIPEETSEKRAIAPGMPFHPFPPLPSSPRDRKHVYASSSSLNSTRPSNHNRREPKHPSDQRPIRSSTVNRAVAMDASGSLKRRRCCYSFDREGNRFQERELERLEHTHYKKSPIQQLKSRIRTP